MLKKPIIHIKLCQSTQKHPKLVIAIIIENTKATATFRTNFYVVINVIVVDPTQIGQLCKKEKSNGKGKALLLFIIM
jgi:hypothetical protein